MKRRIIVGVTGASGSLYAARLLRALDASTALDAIDLVVSTHGRTAIREELDVPSTGELDLKRFIGEQPSRIQIHPNGAVESRIASGSNPSLGMVVVPCSVATVAKIANGISDGLLTRAADVCLKEQRKLLLVVRETPLSRVHLRNMLSAAEAGATIMPAMPAFYSRPATLDDMVDQFVARILDHFDLEHALGTRWRSNPEA